ncbi:TRAP transporter fused permease subunit [Labrenzia sp. OB1]|uniref:TRAP transporter permease n=1 Tax=Labrenzia sp. OB1 TaxID=1561204 RepID=UPI000ABD83FF|nr:TRAP transporter fused permease subunit [Labrenzia sp. OB1]
MPNDRTDLSSGRLARRVALTLAFFMALIPLGHKLPAFGPMPRIGPFEAEPMRGGVLALSVLICVVLASFGRQGRGPFKVLGYLFDTLLITTAAWACWRFYVDVTAMHQSIVFFEPWQAWTSLAGCLVILVMTWRVWGAPLALVAGAALLWFLWDFRGDFVQATTENLWMVLDDGVLGNIMDIVLSTVFPFIILGAMLEGCGAGGSLIRVSFHTMRRFRGGPAHAAILASSLFGAVSGSAVANVVGTGVITIPMIKRRGFSANFAGGVEAAASTGGQVMPPIMGAAALVMADLVGVSYLTVIVAALIPALTFYGALFASVIFESRRLGIEVAETIESDMMVTAQDWRNLALVAIPLAVVIISMIQGASPSGAALTALAVLIPLSFMNPAVRQRPFALVEAFARGGLTFAQLMMAVGAIGIVVASLSSTGLPTMLALQLDALSSQSLTLTLVIAALGCILLGMGMPTLPAYLTIIVISGSAIMALGLSALTAHFFVFYFGVASAITPPVAIAAYAAAAISGGSAIGTGVSAARIGVAIFAIPFMFTFNPQMLLVSAAGGDAGTLDVLLIIVRSGLMIWMLTSAANRFDARRLSLPEAALRLAAAAALISPVAYIHLSAVAVAGLAIVFNRLNFGASADRKQPAP